ncbi:tonB-system energizer ExbB [Phyllobacterium sophorae]|uniref:Biopolymer transport protein ExbB n=2 Tax=Phyllobacterium sophorae TaxID=1520277 RepID=A0A2P7B8K4_9HYPH|nr:tonB-system energizer ExbB [Phyllobacterium sophorae]PSH62797.1 tonB-system energizer ExbB [Phyllobacterium sophorae]
MRATSNGQARADRFMAGLRAGALGCTLVLPCFVAPAAYAQEPATPAPQSEVAPQPATTPEVTTAPAVPSAVPAETAQPDQKAVGSLPHNLSPWGMFMAADWVVKAVMIGLAFASLVTWTVWLAKTLELAGARVRAYRALNAIGNARTLRDAERALEGRGGPGALFVSAAREEVRMSIDVQEHASADGLKERVASRLARIEAQAGRRMSRGTGVLATIGSTAPFVGLFGTVWGIMNAFIGISESQTTNLAIVAPGIAEALLATAIGLVAAIPAVVIYNVFARSITGYRQLLADASAGVERLVSRDVDFALVPKAQHPRAAAAE